MQNNFKSSKMITISNYTQGRCRTLANKPPLIFSGKLAKHKPYQTCSVIFRI